jgi:hypothetical protein
VAVLAATLPATAAAHHPIKHKTFFVGSIPTGAVYRGDLRTGTGDVLVQPQAGRAAIGLKVSRDGRLFVAGGPTGKAFVYDARTGAPLAEQALAGGTPFINDVALRHGTAYFTNSRAPEVFAVPLRGGPCGTSPSPATSSRPAMRRRPTSSASQSPATRFGTPSPQTATYNVVRVP